MNDHSEIVQYTPINVQPTPFNHPHHLPSDLCRLVQVGIFQTGIEEAALMEGKVYTQGLASEDTCKKYLWRFHASILTETVRMC